MPQTDLFSELPSWQCDLCWPQSSALGLMFSHLNIVLKFSVKFHFETGFMNFILKRASWIASPASPFSSCQTLRICSTIFFIFWRTSPISVSLYTVGNKDLSSAVLFFDHLHIQSFAVMSSLTSQGVLQWIPFVLSHRIQ